MVITGLNNYEVKCVCWANVDDEDGGWLPGGLEFSKVMPTLLRILMMQEKACRRSKCKS